MLHAAFTQQLLVQAFWHRSVDVDLVVTDPCGNLLSQRDLLTADCVGQTSRVTVSHSCAAPSMQSRFERIIIGGFPPPPGEYIVSASYAAFSPGDPDCAGFGPEDVTAVVHRYDMPARWRTVTIAPGEMRIEILRFTLP